MSRGDVIGTLPIGYNIFVHAQNHPRYEGNGYILITGFERGPDRDIEYVPQNMRWHLQYHAIPTTIDEVLKDPQHKKETERFVYTGIDEMKRVDVELNGFIAENAKRTLAQDHIESRIGRFISTGDFYFKLLSGLKELVSLDQYGNYVRRSLEGFVQTKKDFEAYKNPNR